VPLLHDIGLHLDNAEVSIVRVDEGAPIAGKTLAEADLRRRYAVTVLAVRRGTETLAGPDGGTVIEAGDLCILVEAGPGNPDISSLFRHGTEGQGS